MAFCKFSTEFIASGKTEIDNIFLNDYLPFAQPEFVVVYIYGLYLCQSNGFDNSIENFAKTLNMQEEDVLGAFEFWQEQGLVQLLATNPVQVVYVPLKNVLTANKLYKPDKYELFNQQANDIFKGKRSISKHEYQEYYDFLERYHMEQEALLMIMKYCVESKKSAVGYNYILTVARNWAAEGVNTALQVEERLKSFENNSPEMTAIFKEVGLKRAPYVEERSLLEKWRDDMGFSLDVILQLCKVLKKKNRFSFEALDNMICKYYEMKLMSVMEIEGFEAEKKDLYNLAKEVNKTIGVYYENLETVVENYILRWINLGFEKNLLLEIASYCFKNSVRTLEGMDRTVQKFYKLGILTVAAFEEYMGQVLADDEKIKALLLAMGVSRGVCSSDRNNYRVWTEDWHISDELLTYAAQLSKGKDSPQKYLSRALADWRDKGIKTVDEAKATTPIAAHNSGVASKKGNFGGRSYTKTEINALFQSIDEIDV